MSIEQIILSNLIYNDGYARKVIPFLKSEYFQNQPEKVVFELVDAYTNKYSKPPSKEALYIDLSNTTSLNESMFNDTKSLIHALDIDRSTTEEWLIENTEKFCKNKALYNAVMTSIQIIDDKKSDISVGSLPDILRDALSVSFDTHIGHDFIEDAEMRYELYHKIESKIPFDIDYFNKITKGGVSKKTLNVLIAGTGVGKSLVMCHFAAANLMLGKNVLYLTLEMAEEKIAERIDANLMNVVLDELPILEKDKYLNKIQQIQKKTNGRLIIKEYPTASANVTHFRHLLNELKLKRKFVPDIIYVDYLNLCSSARIKMGANINSYTLVKAIAEELRGLAIECNVPIFSATQTNRTGQTNSDIGIEDVSESIGLPQTCDLFIALISNENLENLNQILVKQLKNRYAGLQKYGRFMMGVDKSRMKLYDVEQSAQDDLIDTGPVMNKTKFGQEDSLRVATKFDKKSFKDFK